MIALCKMWCPEEYRDIVLGESYSSMICGLRVGRELPWYRNIAVLFSESRTTSHRERITTLCTTELISTEALFSGIRTGEWYVGLRVWRELPRCVQLSSYYGTAVLFSGNRTVVWYVGLRVWREFPRCVQLDVCCNTAVLFTATRGVI